MLCHFISPLFLIVFSEIVFVFRFTHNNYIAILWIYQDLLLKKHHQQCSNHHQANSSKSLFWELLLKDKVWENDGYDDAELVNGNDNTDLSVLDGIIIAKPRCSRRNTRKPDKQKLFLINVLELCLLSSRKNDHPSHNQNNTRSYSRSEIGFYPRDAHFCKYR